MNRILIYKINEIFTNQNIKRSAILLDKDAISGRRHSRRIPQRILAGESPSPQPRYPASSRWGRTPGFSDP